MKEINAIPWNGYTVASTFSGGGGSSLGYKMAGFRVAWANEFIPVARATYEANHPTTILDGRDIRVVHASDILQAIKCDVGDLDLFDGSPPCASFSTAGKRETGWGKVKQYSETKQRTDDLFYEYARLVKDLQPKVFVAENVSGLVKGTAKGYFLDILKTLKSCGYRVEAKVLDAQWLGVPQSRQRLIFVGVRRDLDLDPVFPRPLSYSYTLQEVICRSVTNEYRESLSPYMRQWWELTPRGKTLDIGHRKLDGKTSGMTKTRLAWDRTPPTVLARGSGTCDYYHPDIPAGMAISELKRICAFPDDFILTGTYRQQWERLGRAVPPVMMSHIAATLRDEVLCKHS